MPLIARLLLSWTALSLVVSPLMGTMLRRHRLNTILPPLPPLR